MDLTFPSEIVYPIGVAAGFPVTLMIVARVGALRGRRASQFAVTTLLQLMFWILGSLALPVGYRPTSPSDWALGTAIQGIALLFYLEIWALLSRGYTLAMLTTLARSPAALRREDLAKRYRSGAGLDWILHHRVGGLQAAGLVRQEDNQLELTQLGTAVVLAYQTAIILLGLRRSG